MTTDNPPPLTVGKVWVPNSTNADVSARKIIEIVRDLTPFKEEMEQIFWEETGGSTSVSNRRQWDNWVIETGARET